MLDGLEENELTRALGAVSAALARSHGPKDVPDAFRKVAEKLTGLPPVYASMRVHDRFSPITGRFERIAVSGNGTIASTTVTVALREPDEPMATEHRVPLADIECWIIYQRAP